MTVLIILFSLFFVFLASTALTGLVYRNARKRGWLAIPNERSSHTVPTPTGGGMAIAVVALVSVVGLWAVGLLQANVSLALVSGGTMVVLISWIDGRHNLKARIRIGVHALAAVWALWFLGGLPSIHIGAGTLSLGIAGNVIGFFWIVGLSNLYNFMDGIDGLLGSETIVVGTIAGILLMLSGASGIALLTWIIAASSAGFLMWNWHPAKIFMGDTGSVLIGFSFATLAISSERAGTLPLLVWAILLGLVIIDAGLSTLRRAVKGEKWFEAHRTFGYHRALERGLNHADVTLRVMGLNLIVIAGALVSFYRPTFLLPVLGVVFVFFSWLWWSAQKRPPPLVV